MRSSGLIVVALCALSTPGWLPAQTDEPVLGRSAAIRAPVNDQESVRLDAGTRIRREPRRDAAVLEILGAAIDLPLLETREGWIRVQYGAWKGWVHLTAGNSLSPSREPIAVEPAVARIARARALLDPPAAPGRLGPFPLHTDVTDDDLLEWLSTLAADTVDVYRSRFDLDTGTVYPESVILFSNRAAYNVFQAEEPRLTQSHSLGYSSNGLAVLSVGIASRQDIGSVLVHELTHLLNRRVFGAGLPAWLDEGLAEDLAYCRIDRNGRLRVSSLGGNRISSPTGSWRVTGAKAHLVVLLEHWDTPERPSLSELPILDRDDFLDPGRRSILYSESTFVIRMLLDDSEPELRTRFLSMLDEIATSELVESVPLWSTLEVDPLRAETRLYRFLVSMARAHRLPNAGDPVP